VGDPVSENVRVVPSAMLAKLGSDITRQSEGLFDFLSDKPAGLVIAPIFIDLLLVSKACLLLNNEISF
jgi:hypothetical protein